MKTDEKSRTDNCYDIIVVEDGNFSPSPSADSFYRSHSNVIDEDDNYNLRNSANEIDSPEPLFHTIINWAYRIVNRLSYNFSHCFGLNSCVSPPEDDFVEPDHPPGRCTEIAGSIATYALTLASLATIASAVTRVSILGDSEYPVPISESSARSLLPIGVFVYSFIFSMDRRPPRLVNLFSNLAEVRATLIKNDPVVPNIYIENESTPQLTVPLLKPAQKNLRQVRDYRDLTPMEITQVRKFAGLLRQVINPDGSTGQWFDDSSRTVAAKDKWRVMRIYGLFMKNRSPGCDLYLISELDIGKCGEITGDAVILANNNTACFLLNGKIVMEEDKLQVVRGINRQNITLTQSIEPRSYKGSEWKKWKIFKEAIQKGGHTKKIESHIRDRDEELIEKLKQDFSRERDNKTLDIISTKPESIKKKHLETLHDMTGALIYASKNSYLNPPSGFFTKLMNWNYMFIWSVFLFVTGSTVVTAMMSLDLGSIVIRFLNRTPHDSPADSIKQNENAATIIFISPIPSGMLALWAQLNTRPRFYGSYPKTVQSDTPAKRLYRWANRFACSGHFHNPDYLRISKVVDLSIFGIAVGLLIDQPNYLNNLVLSLTAISYFAAKPFALMIPNLFRNYLGRRLQSEENKHISRDDHSSELKQPVDLGYNSFRSDQGLDINVDPKNGDNSCSKFFQPDDKDHSDDDEEPEHRVLRK